MGRMKKLNCRECITYSMKVMFISLEDGINGYGIPSCEVRYGT